MPNLYSGSVQIIGIISALIFLFRHLKVSVTTRQHKFSKSAGNPDKIMTELDSLPPQVKQFVEARLIHSGSLGESTSLTTKSSAENASRIFVSPSLKVKARSVSVGTSSPKKSFIIGMIFAVCGIVTTFVVTYEQKMALDSINWSVTDGHITSSYNYYRKFESTPNVTYSYDINGQKYFNNRIAFNDTWVQGHYDAPKKFPLDSAVKVRYSPANPSCSCLELGNPTFLGQRLYLAILFFSLAVFMIVISLKGFQNKKEIESNSLVQK
jgi:hypothetical protein